MLRTRMPLRSGLLFSRATRHRASITNSDFAPFQQPRNELVWQPVAPWIPGRTALAYGSGLLMLFGGLGLLVRATAAWSARILFPYLITSLLLNLPPPPLPPHIDPSSLRFDA